MRLGLSCLVLFVGCGGAKAHDPASPATATPPSYAASPGNAAPTSYAAPASALTCDGSDATVCDRECSEGKGEACMRMSLMFALAKNGLPKDNRRAHAYATRSCEAGYGIGCRSQGLALELGIVGPADLPGALELYARACRLGDPEGCKFAQQGAAHPELLRPPVDKLGDIEIGSCFASVNAAAGFSLVADPSHAKPVQHVSAYRGRAKLAGRPVLLVAYFLDPGLATFTPGKPMPCSRLVDVGLVIVPRAGFGLAEVKREISAKWGDPGPMQAINGKLAFRWVGSRGVIALVEQKGDVVAVLSVAGH